MEIETSTIQGRIEETQKKIEMLKLDLKASNIEKEKRLLAGTSVNQIEGEIGKTTREIARAQMLKQALERKQVETRELQQRAQNEKHIKKLQAEAEEIEKKAAQDVTDLEELWNKTRNIIDEINDFRIRAMQIRTEGQNLKTNIRMDLPELGTPVELFRVVHNPTVQSYFKRVRGQIQKIKEEKKQ